MPSAADTERAAAIMTPPAFSGATAGTYLVVGLHGYGGQGSDIRAWLGTPCGGRAHLYTPDAPHPAALAGRGFEWFPLTGDTGRMQEPAQAAARDIAKDIGILQAHLDIDGRHTAVVGFSQGAIVASRLVGLAPAARFVLANGRVLPPAAQPSPGTHVLVLAGGQDRFAPATSIQADLSSAPHPSVTYELIEVPGVGHEMSDRSAHVVAGYLNANLMNEQKAS